MDSASVEVVKPVEAQVVAPATSPEASRYEQTKQMLANARNTKKMLEDFLVAIQGSQVSGHVVYRLAIGIQFLETLLKQSKEDIERLQVALEVK